MFKIRFRGIWLWLLIYIKYQLILERNLEVILSRFFLKENESTFECSIEPNSLVYDFYNDKEVKIDGLTQTYTVQAGDRVILVLNYQQAGLIISSASIKISSEAAEPEYSPCFPNDQYYDPEYVKCVSKTETNVALIEELTGSSNYQLKVSQYIYHHITKYACFTTPSQF